MRVAGIDIGSRTIKIVLLQDGNLKDWEVADATSRPHEVARGFLEKYSPDSVMATGYGRHMLEVDDILAVTEIKACARGIGDLAETVDAVIDIGGQDLKVIALDQRGKVSRFEMNDRCAAGTGRFLEIMAEKLDYSLDDFARAAIEGRDSVTISSMCTVFAESEVVGLLNRDHCRGDIARAVHRSVVKKLCSMFGRTVGKATSAAVVGGGARNSATVKLLGEALGIDVSVPRNPQIVVAMGAALLAMEHHNAVPSPSFMENT